jgi:Ca2+-transporting ATPase
MPAPAPVTVAEQAHRLPFEAVVTALGSDVAAGLAAPEAVARLARDGRNELAAGRTVPAWRKFLAQFQEMLVALLLVATAISALLWYLERDSSLPYEAIAIGAVVLLNAIMGFVQEARAESAVLALRHMSAARAEVVRDGRMQDVPAAELVAGDLILLDEGDTVPADARIVESVSLHVAEAALTGESQPVSKAAPPTAADATIGDRHSMVWSGTVVTYGHGRAVVVATGMRTEMGRIAGMLSSVPDEVTPLQKELDRVGKVLGVVVSVIALVMITTILLVTDVSGLAAHVDVLIVGVALAVAAVPEGLPAIVTAVLSIGVQRMARRNAIVRHMRAVETLGSADVIASDKTGTLTRNEMTVRVVATASGAIALSGTGYTPSGSVSVEGGGAPGAALRAEVARVLTAADRANNASVYEADGRWLALGDPTEIALIVAARRFGIDETRLDSRFPRIGEVPFSSERKLMTTVHDDTSTDGTRLVFVKGAPDVLLRLCTQEQTADGPQPLDDARRRAILAVNDDLALRALRTLGIASRRVPAATIDIHAIDPAIERDLVFDGLVGMIDPPREEARDAVARARHAGIRAIMITGDHPLTAAVIARDLGIADGEAVTGAALERLSDADLADLVTRQSVFARVVPQHKLRIFQALQRQGAVVAMTGDGVNDAPALKTADIGVAMGITGTDVSKEASDMILVDDNFASIVAAVEEGRAIFDNIRKFLRYLLSSNIGEVLTMFLGLLLAPIIGLRDDGAVFVLPLLATQLLWINLVTDGAPALALGVDPASPGLMDRPPRSKHEGVITSRMWRGIVFVGLVMAAGTLLVLDAALPGGLIEGTGDIRYGQTMAFTTLMMFQLFNVFNARSDEASAFSATPSNPWLWAGIGLSLALHAAAIYVPFLQHAFSTTSLAAGDWVVAAATASSVLWLREIEKWAVRSRARVARQIE